MLFDFCVIYTRDSPKILCLLRDTLHPMTLSLAIEHTQYVKHLL